MCGSPDIGSVACDNISTIQTLAKRDLTARSRHIRVHLGFVYDAIDSGEIMLEYRESKKNEADTFTKALDVTSFRSAWAALANLPRAFDFAPRHGMERA